NDSQWKSLRRTVADAQSRHTESIGFVDRAVEALATARTADLAQITPALVDGPKPARPGWKDQAIVASLALLAAWGVAANWRQDSIDSTGAERPAPVDRPARDVINMEEFESEFGVPVVGVVELARSAGT